MNPQPPAERIDPIIVKGRECIAIDIGDRWAITCEPQSEALRLRVNGQWNSDCKGAYATFVSEAAAIAFAQSHADQPAPGPNATNRSVQLAEAHAPSREQACPDAAFGCVKNTIRLRSGLYFDFLDPQSDQFTLADIAGALSKICRFGGQCDKFYSVAEHSVHCVWQAYADGRDPEACMAVLFHDAAEAFCGDVVKPLKIMLPGYAEVERRVEAVIADALDIDFAQHAKVIREIDHAMLIAERRAMFSKDDVEWFGENEVRRLSIDFKLWTPDIAEAEFVKTADELTGVSTP